MTTAIAIGTEDAPALGAMKTVAIIQARIGSRRLPGKVLMDINGKPMLHHVIERTLEAVKDVIVATTIYPEDNAVAEACSGKGVRVFRGHPTDVLERYIQAAREVKAEKVIRITADCPMLSPIVIKSVLAGLTREYDYSSNLYPRTFPKGLDCEAMWFDTLLRLDRISLPEEREHVTLAINRCKDLFKITNLSDAWDASFNWSVDTKDDLERVTQLMRQPK